MNKKLDFSSLRNVISSLQDALGIVADEKWFSSQNQRIQNTLIAGVVQNFEFVYELSIKMLRRQLELEADSPESIDHASYRDMLRTAAGKGLITDVEKWFDYRYLRNLTSHTYDIEKAKQVYAQTLVFIDDAVKLLQNLESRSDA